MTNRRTGVRLVIEIWPIIFAMVGLDISAVLFPTQTIAQIIGIMIGWAIGFATQRWIRDVLNLDVANRMLKKIDSIMPMFAEVVEVKDSKELEAGSGEGSN